jgi:hypothetical protein
VERYRDDEETLSQQFVLLQLLLERSSTLNRVKKEQIKGRLTMFEQLFEESPMIQKMREQYIMRGKVMELQELLVKCVQTKYPDLGAFAQQQASHCDKLDVLELLIQQVMTAPDANTIRGLLEANTEIQGP